jgi:hypothetical protein
MLCRAHVVLGCCALVLASSAPHAADAVEAPVFETRDLKEWLSYIASDDLQGRQAYTEGIGLAAAYIARHLEQFGVQPAGDGGTFFQTVKIAGVRTRGTSSVTVMVNGQSRTFKDGEGVTFPRNQGARQTVSGAAEFVGYGVRFAPLNHDDYANRSVAGKVAVFIGRGPQGFTDRHNRVLNARGRTAVETQHARASISPVTTPPTAAPVTPADAGQRVDFQTAQRLDALVAPEITAGDDFFAFLFNAAGHDYASLKASANRREALPRLALENVRITITIDAEYDVVQTRLTRNVVGRVPGTDAKLRDSYVLYGAHYDHVGYQQFPSRLQPRADLIATCAGQSRPMSKPGDVIYNGADDDGSGTVSLMAIARAYAQGPRPKRSMMFVWHTSEEGGRLGSTYMADHPVVPLESVAAQLNIDMIGRNRCDDPTEANTVYLVGSDRISTELHDLNEGANASLPKPLSLDYQLNDAADLESIYTRSDHYSYASKGVPIIFFTTGLHRDYHYVTDEVEKIQFDKMARIAQLAYMTGWRVGNLNHIPVRDNKGPRASLPARTLPTP